MKLRYLFLGLAALSISNTYAQNFLDAQLQLSYKKSSDDNLYSARFYVPISSVDSIEKIAHTLQDEVAHIFRSMPENDVQELFGTRDYGSDTNKWIILYEDQPFTSYPKERVISTDFRKMREIYRNGPLKAVYEETTIPG